MHTANFAFGPAHRFDVIETIIVRLEFGGYVYELHNAGILAQSRFCVKCIITLQLLYNPHSVKNRGRGTPRLYSLPRTIPCSELPKVSSGSSAPSALSSI